MSSVIIRAANAEDSLAILQVHFNAVHQTAARDYDSAVLNLWSPPIDEGRLKSFNENSDKEVRLVAEFDNGVIAGFGAAVLSLQELRACYVDPLYGGRGVGRTLLFSLEKMARDQGIHCLRMDSSLTAKDFYEANGYRTVSKGIHRLRGGHEMACVEMRKDFF